ncbi:MAG: hypothetical protein O3C40_31920 [Planctomycetota bacterium]|nr:hypothetical protein [Planctomycetota bacterium]
MSTSSQTIATSVGEVRLTPSNLGDSRGVDVEQATSLGLTLAGSSTQLASLSTVGGTTFVEDTGKSPGAHVVRVGGLAVLSENDSIVSDGASTSQTLQQSAGSGLIRPAGAEDNNLLVTGFEAAEGFSTGFIGSQSGWSFAADNTVQPIISAVNPQSGSQQLRIEHDPALGEVSVGAFSPNLGTLAAGHYSLSVDVAISATGGAAHYVIAQAPSQSLKSAEVLFWYSGDIYVLDDPGGGLQYVDTGANWTVGSYENLIIDVDANANTINYSYAGVPIYTGVVWGGTSFEQVILRGNNRNDLAIADFDNLVVQDLSGDLPNLLPLQYPSWNSVIPIGIAQLGGTDDHTYDGPYFDNQVLYFNRASLNDGLGLASQYSIHMEVTGSGGQKFDWNGLTTSSNFLTLLANDRAVGPLSPGTHTFKLWVDYLDSAYETLETDNYYERTITVLPAGGMAEQPVTAEPLGVSEGISWFQVNGTITDASDEQLY